jgi:lysophospholipase L1-like esterase
MPRIFRFSLIVFLALVLAAIVIQDFTDAVPEGLFNSGRGVYTAMSWMALVLVLFAIAVLVVRELRGSLGKLADMVGGMVVFVVVLELLVTVGDIDFMSRRPDAPLGGPYYEMKSNQGDPVIFRKHNGPSPFGFRTDEAYTIDSDAYRVLFLGDSYTEGSGRRAECNYPTVVERELAARLGRKVEVVNAGVSGYGPVQALNLFRELLALGYRFDTVVYNFLTENDFTDNLPGTRRRAVAGMAFRFPRSRFLRTFHPLNSTTFRTAMFLRGLIRIRYELDDFSAVEPGPCDLDGESLDALPETLRDIATRKLDDVARIRASEATVANATAAIADMRRESEALGMPFVLVVFPDRLSVDPELQSLLGADSETLQAVASLRTVVRERLGDTRVIDATPALEGRSGLFRRVDTHLSDLGNVVAGEWVAARLAELLE